MWDSVLKRRESLTPAIYISGYNCIIHIWVHYALYISGYNNDEEKKNEINSL